MVTIIKQGSVIETYVIETTAMATAPDKGQSLWYQHLGCQYDPVRPRLTIPSSIPDPCLY